MFPIFINNWYCIGMNLIYVSHDRWSKVTRHKRFEATVNHIYTKDKMLSDLRFSISKAALKYTGSVHQKVMSDRQKGFLVALKLGKLSVVCELQIVP